MICSLSPTDPHSYSNPQQCVVTDVYLKLEVDFKKKNLKGFVDLSLEKIHPKSDLILDTKDLTILNVRNKNNLNKINYILGQQDEIFGAKLEVKIPKRTAKKSVIRIEYETSPNSSALEWLNPVQTSGKKHPFLFTSCQPIFARSFFPCQDTPAVKTPYSATITAPKELTVLMSALRDGEEMNADPLMRNFKFVQKNPVPSFSFALIVGSLENRQIGPRSHVWAEEDLIEKAASEFSEVEKIIVAAEEILGEYVWEAYDLLVLPPSFQYGGIENPCITFVTSSLLSGDKSLVPCIVHEIIHSWTGNLVTQKNYEHFWLNEGFTQFLERKLLGRLHGEQARHFAAIEGWRYLEYTIETIDKDNLTKLVPDLKGICPTEALTAVPFEKGHTFLFYLEKLLGGAEVFDEFIKAYVKEYSYKSIDTDAWKLFLHTYFSERDDVLKKVDWNKWIHAPGMPPMKPDYDESLSEKCKVLCRSWVEADENDLEKLTSEDIVGFSSNQIREFLTILLQENPLSVKKLEKMEEIYHMNETLNSTIRFRWIRLCLSAKWTKIIPHALKFITEHGRINFLRPIYRDLYEWKETREKAISNFKAHWKEVMLETKIAIMKELHLSLDDL